jgi:hypothetical protein
MDTYIGISSMLRGDLHLVVYVLRGLRPYKVRMGGLGVFDDNPQIAIYGKFITGAD